MAEGKVALITAGGSGTGADAARRLVADGGQVGILSPSWKGEALGPKLVRYGRADEVSSLISWLASEDDGYMTGQNLRIDGGLTRAV